MSSLPPRGEGWGGAAMRPAYMPCLLSLPAMKGLQG